VKLAALAVVVLLTGCASTAAPAPTATPTPRPTISVTLAAPPGVVLPDRARTPGATNPAVTQATIRVTICVAGWTATIRPPAAYTTRLKRQQLAAGYAYRGDMNPADYEEDHRAPLEIGGDPRSTLNLWPEEYEAPKGTAPKGYGAQSKDRLENYVKTQICASKMTLTQGQAIFLGNYFAWRDQHLGAGSVRSTTASGP